MTASILEMFRLYLRREASLDDLREWLALNQWDLSAEDEELADDVDVALVHLDDGYIDEQFLRHQLAYVLERHTVATVVLSFQVSQDFVRYGPQIQKSTTVATNPRLTMVTMAVHA